MSTYEALGRDGTSQVTSTERRRYTVAVDFDGVLHRYDTQFEAPHIIRDEPVEGALEWLSWTVQRFDVVIFTTRGRTWRGRRAVRRWLRQHAGNLWTEPAPGARGIESVTVTATKPAALVYIDDRAFRFDGKNFPMPHDIHRLRPWHKLARPHA